MIGNHMRHIHASCRIRTVQIFFISKNNATMPSMRILSAMFHVKVWQGLIFFDAVAIVVRTPAGSLVMVAVYGRYAGCRSWPLPAHKQKKPRQQARPGRI